MSCLNMRRLFSGRKIWKIFSSKLETKLHSLSRSKAIKKPTKTGVDRKPIWASLISNPRREAKNKRKTKKKFRLNSASAKTKRSCYFQKGPAPVYIDQLFIEPAASVKEHTLQPSRLISSEEEIKDKKSKAPLYPPSTPDRRDAEAAAGTSREGEEAAGRGDAADDMWESLVLGSPAQMHGIDDRAEEFISSFRAEMRRQEMLARYL